MKSCFPIPASLRRSGSALVATMLAVAMPAVAADLNLKHQHKPQLEEIIITGQGVGSLRLHARNAAGSRLGLSPLETPASVDMITRDDLTTKGDHGTIEAITRTAGLSSNVSPGNGGTAVSSRGFSGHDTIVTTYDGTRLYVSAGTITFPADTWTLERVEILRGAGSVINGVGALGATVNYVPKAPVLGESEFEAVLAAGSFGMKRLALGGGSRLSENWAYRMDAVHQQADGYVQRADEARQVLAASLLYQPDASFSMKFSLDFADIEPAALWGTPLINGEASDTHRRRNYNVSDAFIHYRDLWARVRTEWQISPNLSFRNDTYWLDARRQWQNLEEYTYNAATNRIDRASYIGIIHGQQQAGTHSDLLIESNLAGLPNKMTLGAEANVINFDYLNNFNTGGFDFTDSVPVSGSDPGMPVVPEIVPDYTTDTTQAAIFLDDRLQLTDSLSLVLGGRLDLIDFERLDHAIGIAPASSFDTSFETFTWRAGLVYQPSDNVSLYAQSSTATDPVNSPLSISEPEKDFDLSRGRQYELGLKHQIWNDHGEYTLAWFHIEKQDILTRRPGSTVTEQIGQQSSRGLEATLHIDPTDTLGIDVNAAWVDAQFDEFYSGGDSLAGNSPRNIPETTANLWINWFPVEQWQLGAGLRFVGSRFADNANTRKLPSYTVVDAALDWQLSETISISLKARNLTNEEDYVLSEYVAHQWLFGDPRHFELSISLSF